MNSSSKIPTSGFTTSNHNPFAPETGAMIGSKRPPPILSSPTFTPKQMQYIQPPEDFKATPCLLLKVANNVMTNDESLPRERSSLNGGLLRPYPSPIGQSICFNDNSPENSPSPQTVSGTSESMLSDFSHLSLKKEKTINFNATTNIGRLSLSGSTSNSTNGPSARRASVAISQNSSRPSIGGTLNAASQSSNNFGVVVNPPPSKDPRPIREKNFQYSCIKSLIKFLSECGYDRPLSPKLLSSPSAKDFASIFKFLYAQLDPTFIWTPDKKFEEEVPLLLKSLRSDICFIFRYPFANDISKSHLYAVGSMHAWPGLLAMLQWLVDLILCCDQLQSGLTQLHDPLAMVSSLTQDSLNGSKPNVGSNFVYLSAAYKLFLSGDENYELLQTELSAHFSMQTESVEKETELLNADINALEKDLLSFENRESPLVALEKERIAIVADIEKLKKFQKHLDSKQQKLRAAISIVQAQIASTENEKALALENKTNLENLIANQKISPLEAEKLQNEKENLQKMLSSLKISRTEWVRQIFTRERENNMRIDQLDSLISEYNAKGERLLIIPCEAKHAQGKNYQLTGGSKATSSQFFLSMDLKQIVVPVIYGLQDAMLQSYKSLSNQLSTKSEEISALKDSIAERRDELLRMEERIKKTELEHKNARDQYSNENVSLSAEIDHLEAELLKMRSETATGYLASQQQLQKYTLELDQLIKTCNEEKEKCAKEVFSSLEQCINVKAHIENVFTNFEKWLHSLPHQPHSAK